MWGWKLRRRRGLFEPPTRGWRERRWTPTPSWLGLIGLIGLATACSGSSGEAPASPFPGAAPAMIVTPASGFASSGTLGGPFAPGGQDYTVSNQTSAPLDFLVRVTESWIRLSIVGGQLAPAGTAGASITVRVDVDQGAAAALAPGSYAAFVDVLNVTFGSAGSGDTSFRIDLDVIGQANLEVTPNGPFSTSGPLGVGPFDPPSMDYVLRNTGAVPLDWSAQSSAAEFTVSPASGQLAPAGGAGDRVTVTVAVDQNAARGLPPGAHSTTISFTNLTNGSGSSVRTGTLNVVPLGGVTSSSLGQFEITWTFDGDYPVGRFANGDWWVVGPVKIVDISPPSVAVGERVMNGSMVNPSPTLGQAQGYDSHTYGQYRGPGHYDHHLNVAFGVSPSSPLVLPPHSSLVSTISQRESGVRPQIYTAAILTVLPAPPAEGSFRPPYSGTDKTIRFNESQLDVSLLERLSPPPSTPNLREVEAWFELPWIDHTPGWLGGYTHPLRNMPNYGRDIADRVGTASLMLHLDFPPAEKRTLLIRLVQVGIDNFGVIRDGGEQAWRASAGWMSGRKWPILFAGLMLGDLEMSQIGLDPFVEFGEDGQTFVVEETSPGVYNNGYGNYNASLVGQAEWGTAHSWKPWDDDSDWFGDPYRRCCTANSWWGQLLAAYVMGAKPLWNHDVLFDYQERYYIENVKRGITGWELFWSDFHREMWERYRSRY